ncbi:MAG: hypothetical protein GX130_04325 [Candidatus Hydrogenedens sp.]|jgi:CRISPR-associated protein (TIGR03984 family)|nr:hypothetical protein [Candidatus Hydrogenedens sp.]
MSKTIYGATLTALKKERCETLLQWALKKADLPEELTGIKWALAFAADGVVWGVVQERKLLWAFNEFPKACPELSFDNLTELRLFGPTKELHIWSMKKEWTGSLIQDVAESEENRNLAPQEEERLLRADRVLQKGETTFSLVGDNTGAVQAVPIPCKDDDFKNNRWPLRLIVKNYFKKDCDTGMIGIGVTRLVDLKKQGG